MRAVVEFWLKSLIGKFTLGWLHVHSALGGNSAVGNSESISHQDYQIALPSLSSRILSFRYLESARIKIDRLSLFPFLIQNVQELLTYRQAAPSLPFRC